MTKEEIKKQWTKQWEETHDVLDTIDCELEELSKHADFCANNGEANAYFTTCNCITALRRIRKQLENVLYKEI